MLWTWGSVHCSSLTLLLLFELVKLNFLSLLLWKCFVVQEKLEEQREEQTALSKQDPPGQLGAVHCKGQGVFTINFNIAGDGAVIAGLPVPGCWGGVNEGLNRG